MKNTKQQNTNQSSEEELAFLDEFLEETSSSNTFKMAKNGSGTMPLQSLLAALNDAKKIAHSLRSNQTLSEKSKEITIRLTHIETEIAEIKQKISTI